MISESNAYSYCCEDICNIENYAIASSDQSQVWHCHHRAEVLPCGIYSSNDLKKHGLYYNRPASELVFLTKSQHLSVHRKGVPLSKATKEKLSTSLIGNSRHKGCKNSYKQRDNISNGTKAGMHRSCSWQKFIESRKEVARKLKGCHMNVGKDNPSYGKHWRFINNGKVTKRIGLHDPVPEGWSRGIAKKKEAR